MKANELMIGDWVLYRNTIQSWNRQIPNGRDIDTNHNEYYPIPLTEEMLKANEFRGSSIEYGCYYFPEKYQELNDRGFAVESDDEGRFWITDHQLMMIRYVHELQHALRLCGLTELADNFKVE